jgi:hypothetical protein
LSMPTGTTSVRFRSYLLDMVPAAALTSGFADHIPHFGDHLAGLERFSEETAVGRNIARGQFKLAGHKDDLDRRPTPMYGMRKPQAVDAAGHLDVGEDQRDIGSGLQDRNRLVGIYRLHRSVTGVLDHIDRPHAQQHLVFNDENDGGDRRMIKDHHDKVLLTQVKENQFLPWLKMVANTDISIS